MLYDLSLSTTGQDIRCREDEIDQPSTKTEHDYKTEVHSHDERPNKASQNRNHQSVCHINILYGLFLRSLIPCCRGRCTHRLRRFRVNSSYRKAFYRRQLSIHHNSHDFFRRCKVNQRRRNKRQQNTKRNLMSDKRPSQGSVPGRYSTPY